MAHDLRRLDVPLLLLTGDRDQAVEPRESERAARRALRARVVSMPGLGHLAHEEAPEATAHHIDAAFRAATGPRSTVADPFEGF
jgi:magnesium chelatase accessory protein